MTDALPTISVIIPTFNRAHLICDALDSVAAQSRSVDEIVVVDDGSDDDTKAVVLDWATRRAVPLRYVRQDQAGGNAARNRGIDEATGRYIAFLDSDDLWHPEKIAKQMKVIGPATDFGAVYCGLRETDVGTGDVISIPALDFRQGDLLADLLVSDVTAPTSCYLVERRVLLEAGCFDLDLAARQDWDMWIRVAERTKIGCVPEVLVDLRHHSGPRTATDPTRELRAYKRILEKYKSQRRQQGWAVRLRALASYHTRVGRVNLHYRSQRWNAVRHYLLALGYWPISLKTWMALVGAVLPPGLRAPIRKRWNTVFGGTAFAIRSH